MPIPQQYVDAAQLAVCITDMLRTKCSVANQETGPLLHLWDPIIIWVVYDGQATAASCCLQPDGLPNKLKMINSQSTSYMMLQLNKQLINTSILSSITLVLLVQNDELIHHRSPPL
jgi:hypothetical protein